MIGLGNRLGMIKSKVKYSYIKSQVVIMTQKVFVTSNNMASFMCPKCEQTRSADVSKYKDLERAVNIKVKCPCGHNYTVTLERRKQYRKEVNFSGSYTHLKLSEKGTMNVKDISRTGLKLKLNLKRDYQVGDKMMVEFHLDDMQRTLIKKEVIIRKVYENTYGTEFTSVDPSNAYDKALGFYMFG
jgi:hypothetical protein